MIKRNIYLLCAIALLQGMVFYAPIATLYRQAVGIDIFQISLIESISLFLMIALEIPWGWIADRIGYRRTMLICCGLYFLSKLVFWRAETFGGFLLERIMLSVVCAGLSGVDSSMLYLSCGGEDSHRVFSIYQMLQDLGLVLAAGIYALWVGTNYRLAGFLTVITYGLAAILAFGLQEVKKQSTESTGSVKHLLSILFGQVRDRRILFLIIAVALVGETHQAITVFLSQLQYIKAGMSHQMISLAYIAVSLTGLLSGLSARFCRKTGAGKMGALLILTSLICCLLLAFLVHPVFSVLAVVGLRGCFSLLQPLQMELHNRMLSTTDRATALSMNAVLQDGLGIFLTLIFGYIAEVDLSIAMIFGAGICMASLFFFRASKSYL